jgi:hypothetical protein
MHRRRKQGVRIFLHDVAEAAEKPVGHLVVLFTTGGGLTLANGATAFDFARRSLHMLC